MDSRLKELRKEKDVTLLDIETATGIKRSTYSDYENGIVKTGKLETWKKLADYFDVSVPYIQGIENPAEQYLREFIESIEMGKVRETNMQSASIREAGNNMLLNKQLTRLQNTKLHKFEPSTLATAIEMVMNLYERYEYYDTETRDVSSVLRGLNFMINDSIDGDDEYQKIIDTFTKLFNNLKEQNKKASDDKPETER